MALISLPYPLFTNGTASDGGQVTADFTTLVNAINGNLDHNNIGAAGIFASQIKAGSAGDGTFTSVSTGFTFLAGTASIVPLVAKGAAGQTVDLFDAVNNAGTTVFAIDNAGDVTALRFNGSGAGLTAATVPNAALVTAPVTSVSASGNLASSGGLTPALSITATPTFNEVIFGNGGDIGPASPNVLNIAAAGSGAGAGVNIASSTGDVNIFVPDAGGMANLRGPLLNGPNGVPFNSGTNGDVSLSRVGGLTAALFFAGTAQGSIDLSISNGGAFSFATAPLSGVYRDIWYGTAHPSSARELKKDIQPIAYDATALIMGLNVQSWRFNNDDESVPLRVGGIADELPPVLTDPNQRSFNPENLAWLTIAHLQKLQTAFNAYVAAHP